MELQELWKAYDEKLDKSILLNQKIMIEILQQKAKSVLKSTKRTKVFAIVFGIVYVIFLGYLVYHSLEFSKIFFVVSVGIHMIVSAIAIAVYINQLIQINEIDNSENIVQMQQKLANLQSSTLKIVGLCFLQTPVFCTWFISFEWIRDSPASFWGIQMPIVLLFTYIGIWLYRNINAKNVGKKWFRLLFNGSEWTSIINSGKFLKEIEDFKNS